MKAFITHNWVSTLALSVKFNANNYTYMKKSHYNYCIPLLQVIPSAEHSTLHHSRGTVLAVYVL